MAAAENAENKSMILGLRTVLFSVCASLIFSSCGPSFKTAETASSSVGELSSPNPAPNPVPNPLPVPSPTTPPVYAVTWTTNPAVNNALTYNPKKDLTFAVSPADAVFNCFYVLAETNEQIAKPCADRKIVADINGQATYVVQAMHSGKSFSSSVVVKVDSIAPMVKTTDPVISADGKTYSFNVTANEPLSYINYRLDGGASSPAQTGSTIAVTISDYSRHELVISGYDAGGNGGSAQPVIIQRRLPPEPAQNPGIAGVLLNRNNNDTSNQPGNGSTTSWDGRILIRTPGGPPHWAISIFRPQKVGVSTGINHDIDMGPAYSTPVTFLHHEFFPGSNEGYAATENANFVKMCYRILLLREPSAGEVSGWQSQLDTKAATPQDVLQAFKNSPEYKNILAANPAHRFHPEILPHVKFTEFNALALAPYYTDRAFLLDAYQNILGSDYPDEPGLNWWLTELKEKRRTQESVANDFAYMANRQDMVPHKFKNYARLASEENPYRSDFRGEYSANGSYKTYDALLYTQVYKLFQFSATYPHGRNLALEALPKDTIGVMRVRFIISNPDTDDAELFGYYFMSDFQPLRQSDGNYVHGIEPTLTADGLLMVYNANDPEGLLEYVYTENPMNPAAWGKARNLTALHTEKDVLLHGIKLGERYPIAKEPIKSPAGTVYTADEGIKGAYPWISWEGSEVYFTSLVSYHSNPDLNARRAGGSVVGQWTGNAVRLLDGNLNTGLFAYDKLILFTAGIGSTSSFWNPYKNVSNPKLPYLYERPAVMLLGFNDNTYNDVTFKEFTDGRYLVAWPMGELLNKISRLGDSYTSNVDFKKTPDLSGRFNTGVLNAGAIFQSSKGLGPTDRYEGFKGQAIRMRSDGAVTVNATADFAKIASFTAEAFIYPVQSANFKILQLGNAAANVFTVEYYNGRIYASLNSAVAGLSTASAVPLLTWTHVAVTYDHLGGQYKLYINGKLVSNMVTNPVAVSVPPDAVFKAGPAGAYTNDNEVVRMDEVRLSFVARSSSEIADAAHLPYSQRFDFDLTFPQRISKMDLKIPDELMLSSRKAQLGQILFNDKRLSANNTVSCASCHGDSNFSDSRQFSMGLNNNPLARHSPPVFNRALTGNQMWDGKFSGLHTQVLGPVTNPNEMNLTSAQVLDRILTNPSYNAAFKNVYSQYPSLNNIQQAISSFLNVMMTDNTSPADQYELFKDGLSPSQIRGRSLFFGQARCSSCHSGINFTDGQMHNIGIFGVIADSGLQGVTGRTRDARYFKTPSLRNIAQTAPYMHDGRFSNLDQVVAQYNLGGLADPARSNEIKPLNLSSQQRADLVEYLKSLTSPVKAIVPINTNPNNTIEQLGAGL